MTDIITNADKLACVTRELKYRKYVYPRWIDLKRMTAGRGAHEIAAMEAIVADYQKLVDAEGLL
jgi:hypothetical protein